MIVLDNISKKYDRYVIKDFSLTINKGDFVGLLGPNGAGKTTLISMMTGITSITSGMISINNINFSRNNTNYKSLLGMMPQHINLEPELTTAENLKLHGLLYKMPMKTIKKRIDELLDFTDLNEKRNTTINKLSGGMKRKILLARAVMHDPEILLLDEPTVGLDVFYRKKVWDLIVQLNKKGKTVILTTHYLEEAEKLCRRIVLIDKGKLIMDGSKDIYYERFGRIAAEIEKNNNVEIKFYKNHEDALNDTKKLNKNISLRDTTLEDVFIKLTKDN